MTAGRITEWGTTPNKAATLGENVVLLANLAWTAVLFFGFDRRRPFSSWSSGRPGTWARGPPAAVPRSSGPSHA